jgi:hypothetical protein
MCSSASFVTHVGGGMRMWWLSWEDEVAQLGVVMPTLRYFTIETLRFYAFVNKKNLTNVYFSL